MALDEKIQYREARCFSLPPGKPFIINIEV
jgi:hypothetical protein